MTNYKKFETYLHNTYPPLIGTSQGVKGSKITVIDKQIMTPIQIIDNINGGVLVGSGVDD